MIPPSPFSRRALLLGACLVAGLPAFGGSSAPEPDNPAPLRPGLEAEIVFPEADLPPTLYSLMNGVPVAPCLTFRLPDDYDPAGTCPLLVYVPGNDGGRKGNIHNAKTIAGPRGWIVATLPLFKKSVDRSEAAGGVIVGFEDYPVLARAYGAMLGRLFERVPNIDRKKSAMVGFSNGAITIAVLVSNHDEFVLTHFRNFCLVDNGMFHLCDLHKSRARDCRYLLLAGDREDLGREARLRQGRIMEDAWGLLRVNLSFRVLKDTGHEFRDPQMAIVGEWLRSEVAPDAAQPTKTEQP